MLFWMEKSKWITGNHSFYKIHFCGILSAQLASSRPTKDGLELL